MTFEEHVRAALDSLPPQLAGALENVAVVGRDGDRLVVDARLPEELLLDVETQLVIGHDVLLWCWLVGWNRSGRVRHRPQ